MRTLEEMVQPGAGGPVSVRFLRWMFITSRYRDRFRSMAARLLNASA
jgi:hypothetical protein